MSVNRAMRNNMLMLIVHGVRERYWNWPKNLIETR